MRKDNKMASGFQTGLGAGMGCLLAPFVLLFLLYLLGSL